MTRTITLTVGCALAGALGTLLHVPPPVAVPLIAVAVGVGMLSERLAHRNQRIERETAIAQRDQSERRWQ